VLRSCNDGRRLPYQIGSDAEEVKRRSADHVTLEVEGVVDGGVGGKEPLGKRLRFELLLFALRRRMTRCKHSKELGYCLRGYGSVGFKDDARAQ
jgi:hypothetical protein